jgi:hypothetical protein
MPSVLREPIYVYSPRRFAYVITCTAPGFLIWYAVGDSFLAVFKLTNVRLLLARVRVRLAEWCFSSWLFTLTCTLAGALALGRCGSGSSRGLTLASFGGLGHADRSCVRGARLLGQFERTSARFLKIARSSWDSESVLSSKG